jgi:hypothetical protein
MNESSRLTWPRASKVQKTKPPAGRPWPRRACPELRGNGPSCHLLVPAVMDCRRERQGTCSATRQVLGTAVEKGGRGESG